MFKFWPLSTPSPPSTEGALVYAVGDIHGCAALARMLLERIRADARTIARPATLIFLGDYLDRGNDSRAVVELLLELEREGEFTSIMLKGNHEEICLKFLEDPSVGASWARFGGLETLASYGVEAKPGDDGWSGVCAAFQAALPPEHRAFLESLPLYTTVGGYVFVHAGVRPGRAMRDQAEADLLWIREPFLSHRSRCKQVVVHGHTPAQTVQMLGCRIGVDTGAYHSGVLSAVRLLGIDRRIIQAAR